MTMSGALEFNQENLAHRILSLLEQQIDVDLESTSSPAMRSHPLIIVPGTLATSQIGKWPLYGSDEATMTWLRRTGAIPLSLPPLPLSEEDPLQVLTDDFAFCDAFDLFWTYLLSLDVAGLCLAGGGDLYSCFYGQQLSAETDAPELWRDIWELWLALIGWLLRWPTLGICRGMQLMNVALGGGITQDLRAAWRKLWATYDREMLPLVRHRARTLPPTPRTFVPHAIHLDPKSQFAQVLQSSGLTNSPQTLAGCLSMHHQAVGVVLPSGKIVGGPLAHGLSVAALAPDGVIEAFEYKQIPDETSIRQRFYVAVQFHPEWMRDDPLALSLARGFVRECASYVPLSRTQLGTLYTPIRAWLRARTQARQRAVSQAPFHNYDRGGGVSKPKHAAERGDADERTHPAVKSGR